MIHCFFFLAFFQVLTSVFISEQLNAAEIDKTTRTNEKEDEISSFSDDLNSDDQAYQDFLSRTIQESDTDDENFVYELNGDDTSDTDSQSSVATEDLSDDEKHQSANVSVLSLIWICFFFWFWIILNFKQIISSQLSII